MASVILRRNKTSPLTHDEMDDNIANLNNSKAEQSVVDGKAPLSASTASGTSNVPTGGITEQNVQAALDGLDTRKAPLSNPVFAGNVGIGITPCTKLDVNGMMRAAGWSIKGDGGVNGGSGAFTQGTVSTDSNWGYHFRTPTGAGAIVLYEFTDASGNSKFRVDAAGNALVMSDALLGYGKGGSVTQATSKSTPVTLNKPTGQINTASDSLAAGATTAFTFYNSLLSGDSSLAVHRVSGGSALSYHIEVDSIGLGAAYVMLKNISAVPLAEAVNIKFNIIKGASA